MTSSISVASIYRHLGGHCSDRGTGWQRVKCVFHEDRTASASIHNGYQRFKCHSCEFTGDAVDLIRQAEDIADFRSSVARAEEIAGEVDEDLAASKPRDTGRRQITLF